MPGMVQGGAGLRGRVLQVCCLFWLTFTQMTDNHAKQGNKPSWWGLFIHPLVFFFVRSFVVNPLAPIQETVCLLQNETTGASPTVSPQKSVSTYYMIKLNIRSGNNRLNWLEFKRRRLTVTRFCQNGHWLGKSSIFRLRGDERRGRFLTNFVPPPRQITIGIKLQQLNSLNLLSGESKTCEASAC